MAEAWRDFYRHETRLTPSNPRATGRAELMEGAVELLSEGRRQGDGGDMEDVTVVQLTNSRSRPIPCYLEPWGEEYLMPQGATFEVLARGPRGGSLEVTIADGRYHSSVVPGFWLDPNWLWQEPLPKVAPLLAAMPPRAERGAHG